MDVRVWEPNISDFMDFESHFLKFGFVLLAGNANFDCVTGR